MKKTALLVLAAAALLTGCGQGSQTAGGGQTPGASAQPTASTAPSPTVPATPSPSPTPTATPVPSPTPAYYMTNAYYVKPIDKTDNNKVVLLTFDDGPKKKDQVEQMIAILDKHHAKAIFFVNGYRVKENPDVLKEIADAGQAIGNHSWDHIDLSKEKLDKVEQQIGDVQDIVKKLTGKTPVFFRPPYAAGQGFVRQVVKEHNLLYMNWSNGSLDWADNENKPDGLIQSVLDQLHPGSVILMHELPWTIEALDKLLTTLEDKGYSFLDPNDIDLQMSIDQQK